MATRADLFNRYREFAERHGVELARRVISWRGFCASADVRRVQPGVYASLIRSFDDVESGKERLPSYTPRAEPRHVSYAPSRAFDRAELEALIWK